jgi:Co/Zn/Cd efflux system component
VLPSTYRLMRQAVRSLMEAAPPGIDVTAAERRLAGRPAVTDRRRVLDHLPFGNFRLKDSGR